MAIPYAAASITARDYLDVAASVSALQYIRHVQQHIPMVVPGTQAVVRLPVSDLPKALRMALMSELLPAFCAPTCNMDPK